MSLTIWICPRRVTKKTKKTTFQLQILKKGMLLENGIRVDSFPTISNFPIKHQGSTKNSKSEETNHLTIFDNELMQKIVEETNNYQQQNAASNVEKTAAWYSTNVEELYIFFATAVLMGLNQKNRIKDYWSTDKLIITPIFEKIFTRNRYLSILRYPHFADSNTEEEGKLQKIQPIVENLRKRFEKPVIPWENLCIDENLILWKGCLSCKQYVPSKRHRFGVKLFVLCDCYTKFVLNFIVYTGAETDIDKHPQLGIPRVQ